MNPERRIAALEGRILAHRQILARLLAASPGPVRDAVAAALAGRETLADGQEDPGAVPAEGLALELALAEELRAIAEELRVPDGSGPDGR